MGRRTDGLLAAVVLVVLSSAFVASDAQVSIPAFVAGCIVVLALEAAMAPHADTVRRWWARPAVRLGSLAVAIVLVIGGALVSPTPFLSAGIGATAAYLLLLGLVAAGVVQPVAEWF
ncbi:hypothetical protein SAMN05444422_102342 [Halobiforma haloterrestris]|uniref:Uncharacterized protein n=1 Tax=Natronobacterium haloterrestre TaxID=148448 RepID=A0A1I1EB14_NATHA|nr:hypothetical protein [Halobiforma haloterrestris]SFB84305.1 hypothetical protein SAMN05444422_102342 [Halobiforma haloterrestris]